MNKMNKMNGIYDGSTVTGNNPTHKKVMELLGYVACVTFCRTEATLTKDGRISDSPHATEKSNDTHIWKTKEQAEKIMKERKAIYPDEENYVREYYLEKFVKI
jgi:hypothetical protein